MPSSQEEDLYKAIGALRAACVAGKPAPTVQHSHKGTHKSAPTPEPADPILNQLDTALTEFRTHMKTR